MTRITSYPSRIAIVGAGIAGLACAETLAQAGHHIDLFEKSRGVGGRTGTRRCSTTEATWQCDHGTSFFTAQQPAFRQQVARWIKAGVVNKSDLQQLYYGVPGMSAMARHMLHSSQHQAGSVTLHLNSQITAIQRQAGHWSLSLATPDSPQHSCSWQAMVLALPAPQVCPLLPAGSQALALAASVSMAPCWSVIVIPAEPLELPSPMPVSQHSPLARVVCDTYKVGRAGRQTWLLQATTDWSQTRLHSKPQEIAALLLQAFAALGGPAPDRVQAVAHRWLYALTPGLHTDGYWLDSTDALGLCGDWLLQGTVESAWLSGMLTGKQLTAQLANPNPPSIAHDGTRQVSL